MNLIIIEQQQLPKYEFQNYQTATITKKIPETWNNKNRNKRTPKLIASNNIQI